MYKNAKRVPNSLLFYNTLGMGESKMSVKDSLVIIGLTGPFGSGCSTIAKILSDKIEYRKGKDRKYGFEYIKISDILEREAAKRKINIKKMASGKRRKTLQDIGNKLRKEKGLGVLVELAIAEARQKDTNLIVIESIKNPGEVIELKKYPNGYLMAIDAPYDVRWGRVRDSYKRDQRQFDIDNGRDRNEGIESGQNVQTCVDLADIFITNERDMMEVKHEWEEFEKTKIDRVVNLIKNPGSEEPTPMELMMNNAYCTSLLSTCMRRQVGAVITVAEINNKHINSKKASPKTQDQQIKFREYLIATGYNAVPEGELCCEVLYGECYRAKTFRESLKKLKHCPNCGIKLSPYSNRCPKCSIEFKELYPSNSLDLCRSLHAEESAILQTARLGGGVSLVGTTLYTTTFPCLLCANKILGGGIARVIWLEAYPDKNSMELLNAASKRGTIELVEFEGVKAEAFYKLFNKKYINFERREQNEKKRL